MSSKANSALPEPFHSCDEFLDALADELPGAGKDSELQKVLLRRRLEKTLEGNPDKTSKTP